MFLDLNCILCNNYHNFGNYLQKEKILYKKCLNCGLIIRKKNIEKDEIRRNYEDKKYYSAYIVNYKNLIGIYSQILDFIEKFKNSGTILDIGCGLGILLSLAKRRKWDEYGIEISKYASKFAKDNLNLNVINSSNLDNYPDNFFDVIVVNHVLEHIENPLIILGHIYKKINKDGILFVGVPNIGGLFPRIEKENWQFLRPSQHIYQFIPKTIKLLLKKAGFKPIKFKTANREFRYKLNIINLILNKFLNPILEKMRLGEEMTIILKKI
ncbi:hypothetical protein LCGC14_2542250 [marine sediment metagenome]|uniref:Methyltransferase type 11 domain-containing protein n=1 Tax=marine sediment metagenome TaxID=412755 RepID=A0A0F9AQU7_9ZZZZ